MIETGDNIINNIITICEGHMTDTNTAQTPNAAPRKPVVFSGIQPTNVLHIGNYIGSLRNFSALQDDYDCLYCIVDLHAITIRQDPTELRKRCLSLAALYLASGLDPNKSVIYCQSHVSQHSELSWILGCNTYVGELSRMTQYKDKMRKHADNINAGLLTYPVLMAADIILYNADRVPVGADQKQHLELTRDIAIRFNNAYGATFVVPEPLIQKTGSKIMSLAEPTRKMSKSDPDDTMITLLDTPDAVRRKLKRAVTDSDAEIRFDAENKPGVSNLLTIYASLTNVTAEAAADEFQGKGYGELKSRVADVVVATLEPIQREHSKWMADKKALMAVLTDGADKARRIAVRTMSKVRRKVGLAEV